MTKCDQLKLETTDSKKYLTDIYMLTELTNWNSDLIIHSAIFKNTIELLCAIALCGIWIMQRIITNKGTYTCKDIDSKFKILDDKVDLVSKRVDTIEEAIHVMNGGICEILVIVRHLEKPITQPNLSSLNH